MSSGVFYWQSPWLYRPLSRKHLKSAETDGVALPLNSENDNRLNTTSSISSSQQISILVFVGLACTLGYAYLAMQSNHDAGIELFDFLSGYWAIGVLVLAYWLYLRHHRVTPELCDSNILGSDFQTHRGLWLADAGR